MPGAPTGGDGHGRQRLGVGVVDRTASDGGSAITGYTVTSSPGATHVHRDGLGATCTVTGLTNGTPYTFTVTATNAKGTGPASAPSTSVTPATVPGAPTGVIGCGRQRLGRRCPGRRRTTAAAPSPATR